MAPHSISTYADIVAAIGSILIPIVLLYLAPKITAEIQNSNRQKTRSQLFSETSACLNETRFDINEVKSTFDGKAFGKELDQKTRQEVTVKSNKISDEMQLILLAFEETLKEVGRDRFSDVLKAKRASLAVDDFRARMLEERKTWLDADDRKVTGPVAKKHFEKFSQLVDEFDKLLIE